jgi:hypothetical protein
VIEFLINRRIGLNRLLGEPFSVFSSPQVTFIQWYQAFVCYKLLSLLMFFCNKSVHTSSILGLIRLEAILNPRKLFLDMAYRV